MTSFTFDGFRLVSAGAGNGTRLVDVLEGVRDLCDDFSVPMVTIARALEEDILQKIASGVPPPLAESTIERWGEHPILVNTGKMRDSVRHWTTPMSASAGASSKAAVFIVMTGRERGYGRYEPEKRGDMSYSGRGRKRKRGRSSLGRAESGRKTIDEARATGIGYRAWGDMPVRDFIWIDEERQQWAADTILDYLFETFN